MGQGLLTLDPLGATLFKGDPHRRFALDQTIRRSLKRMAILDRSVVESTLVTKSPLADEDDAKTIHQACTIIASRVYQEEIKDRLAQHTNEKVHIRKSFLQSQDALRTLPIIGATLFGGK